MERAPGDGGVRWRELPTGWRTAGAVGAVAVVLPFLVAALSAYADGWVPTGDEAMTASAARQVFTANPPLLGDLSSASKYGVMAYHPGPLPHFVMGPLTRLLGAPLGLLLTAALVAAASMLAIGYAALRTHGPAMAMWAWITALTMVWSLGGTAYHYRPFKSLVAVLPLLLVLHASAALLVGRWSFLPAWAAAASYAIAASAQYVLPVGGVVLLVLIVLVVARARSAGVRGLPPASRRGWLTAGATAAVTVVAWWGPVVDVVSRSGGNVLAMRDGARAATAGGVEGPRSAARTIARALVFDPAMTTTANAQRTVLHLAAAATLLAAGAAVLASRWRSVRRDLRAAAGVGALGLITCFVAQMANPSSEGFGFNRALGASPAAAYAVFVVGAVLTSALPATARSRSTSARSPLVAAAAIAVLACAVAVPGPLDDEKEDVPWAYRATSTLTEQTLDALPAGRWTVRRNGPRSTVIVEEGFASALEDAGWETDLSRPPGVGAPAGRPESPFVGRLLVEPSFLPAPRGDWRAVARYDPLDRDPAQADLAAAQLAAFARASDPRPLPVLRQSLPTLLCPDIQFAGGTCPAADAYVNEADPFDDLPPEVIALAYVENFHPVFEFPLFVGARPPPDLLDAVRRGWVDVPLTVYAMGPGT